VRLAEAVAEVPARGTRGDQAVGVEDLTLDSRQVRPGWLFCCVVGAERDGHDFAGEAVAAGASALLVERPLPFDVAQVVVEDTRIATAAVAAAVHGHPSADLLVVGVTGTNGKTTTTHLLSNVLTEAGMRSEVLGTLSGARTTPEAPDLQRRMAGWRDEGVEAVAMEVSSHALSLHRVDGTRFRVGVFTNLGHDHLDFHGTMEAYFQAKARLFTPEFVDRAVVNLDSPYGRLLLDAALVPTEGFTVTDVEIDRLGASSSDLRWRGRRVVLPLGGAFNVANALAAAATASVLGVADDVVATGLSRPVSLPGRFEPVEAGQPFAVVVDFAHTPDGLAGLLEAASSLGGDGTARGAVTVVFGCGGERDPDKRPSMGEVAARGADRVVVTSDNSRGEPTGAIIDAIVDGYERAHPRRSAELVVEPDRRLAIAAAIRGAAAGDVVLVAGKGHERTQDLGGVVQPFDDRAVALEVLADAGWGA
jgi:UDP-N-acetylmuramoyl-L-alanyl-D-glutamate--2,6-diaminopimelate ligase